MVKPMSKDIFTEIYERLRLHALREYTTAKLLTEIERRQHLEHSDCKQVKQQEPQADDKRSR